MPDSRLLSGNYPVYILKPSPYQITPASLRSVTDSLSQADGSSIQPPFIPGMTAELYAEYWVQPTHDAGEERRTLACNADLREMDDRLMLHLNSLRQNTTDPGGLQRLMWTPDGYGDDRMIQAVMLAGWPTPTWFASDGIGVGVGFALMSPYPYAIDASEIDTDIADGDTAFITNTGSAEQKPVIRAFGPSTGFVIQNLTTGLLLSYDSSRPGGAAIASGHYAEINFFAGSIFLDGDGADLIAGLDPTSTDFWTLIHGTQEIAATGAAITVLSNNSWA